MRDKAIESRPESATGFLIARPRRPRHLQIRLEARGTKSLPMERNWWGRGWWHLSGQQATPTNTR